jgi:hypothetical protein
LTAIFRLPGRPGRKGTSQSSIDLPGYVRAHFTDSLLYRNGNRAVRQELEADASGQQALNPAGTDRLDTIRTGILVFDPRVNLADEWLRVLDRDVASRTRRDSLATRDKSASLYVSPQRGPGARLRPTPV